MCYFDERAGIAEFDGFLPRLEAEAQWVGLLRQRMDEPSARRHPRPTGALPAMEVVTVPNDPLLPFGTDSCGHAWLHSRCWPGLV